MRNIAAILLALCLLLALGACGRRAESPRELVPEKPAVPDADPPRPLTADTDADPPPVQENDPVIVPEPEPENTVITLSFAGDALIAQMLNRYSKGGFNDYAQREDPSYFLSGVRDCFAADDMTLVNLENVLSDRKLTPRDKGEGTVYWFMAPTRYIDILTAGSVEAVSVANNHTRDYGETGYWDTVRTAQGAGLAVGANDQTIYFEKGGFTVAVICNGLWNEGQAGNIVQRLRRAEEDSDFQIVFYHGGTEGIHAPEAWKVRASRKLVDAGADVVLGGHPHVLQPMESYAGAEILYSLGNFCYGGSRNPENRTVIYQLKLTVSPERELLERQSTLIPCYVHTGETSNDYHPAIIEDGDQRQMVMDFLAGKVKKPL